MALQVWLPLNKSGADKNQGLGDSTITNFGAIYESSGKLGGCYKCTKSAGIYIESKPWMKMVPGNSFSVSMWIKGCSGNTWAIACTSWELNFRTSVLSVYPGSSLSNGGCAIYQTFDNDTWYHIAFSYNGDTSKLSLYLNGEFKQEYVTTYAKEGIASTITLPYGDTRYINDFRLYDECLSADQIKEISRGMVLHYKMYMPINRLNAKTCTPQNGSWTTSTGYNIIISQKDDYFEFTSSPNAAAGSFNGILLSTPFTGKTLKYFWSEVSGVSEFYGYTSGNNDMDFHFSGATVGSPMHAKLRLALYDDNCDFYIPFDTRNIEYDGSGFKNHGTVSGNVTLSADSPRYTGSYSLANGKYITAPGLTYINSGSISFWTKINTLASNGWLPFTGPTNSHFIMATSHGAGVFYHSSIGNGTKTIYEDGKVVTAPTSNGIWHHYVITNVDLTTWTKFMLNNYDSNWNAELQMSDVRVYSTVLDATDVAELYKLGRN